LAGGSILGGSDVKAIDIEVAMSYSRRSLEGAFNLLFLHSAQISRSREPFQPSRKAAT